MARHSLGMTVLAPLSELEQDQLENLLLESLLAFGVEELHYRPMQFITEVMEST